MTSRTVCRNLDLPHAPWALGVMDVWAQGPRANRSWPQEKNIWYNITAGCFAGGGVGRWAPQDRQANRETPGRWQPEGLKTLKSPKAKAPWAHGAGPSSPWALGSLRPWSRELWAHGPRLMCPGPLKTHNILLKQHPGSLKTKKSFFTKSGLSDRTIQHSIALSMKNPLQENPFAVIFHLVA